MTRLTTKALAWSILASLALGLVGCGNSSPASGDAASSKASLEANALDTAKKNLAPYTGHASAFPVDEPLTTKPPAGTTFAYLECATPICALQGQVVGTATHALLGNDLIVVKAGRSAQEAQQAMESIIAKKPSAVILPGIDPVTMRAQMEQLDSAGIPVVTLAVTNTKGFPAIKAAILGESLAALAGKLFADWAVTTNGIAPSVFYSIPELGFSAPMAAAFQDEMKAVCPACQVRVVKIPLTSIGNTAPATVVSDLKANPETRTAVFASEEAATGLPAALKVAGLDVAINGYAPSPTILGYIQGGDVTAGLAVDTLVAGFLNADVAARLVTGQKLTATETAGLTSMQMVTKNDLAGVDVSKGFAAYPDAVQRFGQLWNGQ